MASESWRSETTIKFIQEFESYECLWNPKSPTYKMKHAREAAFQKVAEEMQITGFGVPEINDVVILQRRVNDEWLYGQIGDKEGMFPSNFIDIIVPLPEDDNSNIVTALYEFKPQMHGDLGLMPGQKIKVIKKISNDWLYGESNGTVGQFPTNFVDRVPKNLRC